jgi:hypothetical protein
MLTGEQPMAMTPWKSLFSQHTGSALLQENAGESLLAVHEEM